MFNAVLIFMVGVATGYLLLPKLILTTLRQYAPKLYQQVIITAKTNVEELK